MLVPKRLTKHRLRAKEECHFYQKRGDSSVLINLPIILQLENLENALFIQPIYKVNVILKNKFSFDLPVRKSET